MSAAPARSAVHGPDSRSFKKTDQSRSAICRAASATSRVVFSECMCGNRTRPAHKIFFVPLQNGRGARGVWVCALSGSAHQLHHRGTMFALLLLNEAGAVHAQVCLSSVVCALSLPQCLHWSLQPRRRSAAETNLLRACCFLRSRLPARSSLPGPRPSLPLTPRAAPPRSCARLTSPGACALSRCCCCCCCCCCRRLLQLE